MKEKKPKTIGGSPTVKCTLCHQVRVANATRQKGHLLHLPEGWGPCKGIPDPPEGQQHSVADLQLAAEALAEVQRRMQDVKDKWVAAQEAASRKRQLETTVHTGQQEKQQQQKTLAEVYKRKDKTEVDAAVSDFIFSSGVPFHIVESPYFREMLSAAGSYGPGLTQKRAEKLVWVFSNLHLIKTINAVDYKQAVVPWEAPEEMGTDEEEESEEEGQEGEGMEESESEEA